MNRLSTQRNADQGRIRLPFFHLCSSVLICGSLLFSVGCGTSPQNASFPLTVSAADQELKEIRATRKPLTRPVVVVDGYLDPGLGSALVAGWVRKLTPDEDQVITVNLLLCTNFDACRQKIVDAVEEAFPSDDPSQTREVDVIGVSMGGVAARYAALASEAAPSTTPAASTPAPQHPPKRLRIARLFTLASPHLGAVMADVPTYLIIGTQRDMRRGSSFLERLNDPEHPPDYPIIPYVRLADLTVGERYAAPPGQTPIWLPKGLLESAHAGVIMDPRIAADVSRRLRGETSYVIEPRAPLPD